MAIATPDLLPTAEHHRSLTGTKLYCLVLLWTWTTCWEWLREVERSGVELKTMIVVRQIILLPSSVYRQQTTRRTTATCLSSSAWSSANSLELEYHADDQVQRQRATAGDSWRCPSNHSQQSFNWVRSTEELCEGRKSSNCAVKC